jgi:hypothetical protein
MRRLYLPAAAATIAVVMYLVIFVGEGIDAYYRSRLVDMVHGTAWRPYVTRALVPLTARAGTALTPDAVAQSFNKRFASWTWKPATWSANHAAEYVFVVLAMTASLFAFQSALRRLFTETYRAGPVTPLVAALVGLASLPVFFGPFSRQIYDFTTLWSFTLGLALMTGGQWTAYLVLFAIATVNKETTILLTLVFAVHFLLRGRLPFNRALVLFAAQVDIFLVIRGAISYAFRTNPGEVVEINWENHNKVVLLEPSLMSKRLPLLAAAAAFGAWGWRGKSPLLRDAIATLAPVLLVMGVTVGQVDEIRAYYEFYPIVIVLVADSVCRIAGRPMEART